MKANQAVKNKNKGKRRIYDAAVSVVGGLPYDILEYLDNHPKEARKIIEEIRDKQVLLK